ELGLAHDRRTAAPCLTALAAALLLRLQPGRALERGDLVLGAAGLADPGDGVARVVGGVAVVAGAATTAAAPTGGGGGSALIGVVPVLLAVVALVVPLAGALLGAA